MATFQDYGRPLEAVLEFKYIGRVTTASDYNWPVLVENLSNYQSWWEQISRILGREVSDLGYPVTSTR